MYSLLANDGLLSDGYASFHQEDGGNIYDSHSWQNGQYWGGNSQFNGWGTIYNETTASDYESGSWDLNQYQGDSDWFGGPGFSDYNSYNEFASDHYGWSVGQNWFENDATHTHDTFNFNSWMSGQYSGYSSNHVGDKQTEYHLVVLGGGSTDQYGDTHSYQWNVHLAGPGGRSDDWTHTETLTHIVTYGAQPYGGSKG